jgi:hypothetical protein
MQKERSGAVGKVESTITDEPKTLSQIHAEIGCLAHNQISMALCYLRDKKRCIEAVKVPRTATIGRKEVYAYKKIVRA